MNETKTSGLLDLLFFDVVGSSGGLVSFVLPPLNLLDIYCDNLGDKRFWIFA